MKTSGKNGEANAFVEQLLESPLDEEKYRLIRERQEAITAELKRQNGEMDIAVPLVREARDEQ